MHIALETWGLISLLSHAESFRGFSMFLMQRVAGNLGWTPTLGVAGDASGGGLAMACTLRARKEAAAGAPDIRVQVGSELDHVGLLDLCFKSLTCFEVFKGVEHIGKYWKILETCKWLSSLSSTLALLGRCCSIHGWTSGGNFDCWHLFWWPKNPKNAVNILLRGCII